MVGLGYDQSPYLPPYKCGALYRLIDGGFLKTAVLALVESQLPPYAPPVISNLRGVDKTIIAAYVYYCYNR